MRAEIIQTNRLNENVDVITRVVKHSICYLSVIKLNMLF